MIILTLSNYLGKIRRGKRLNYGKSYAENYARRVLWFYSFLGKFPIVVIRVSELQKNQPYADVTAAVRRLADDFGLHVIVDGSQSSIPPEIKATERQLNIHVMPMQIDVAKLVEKLNKIGVLLLDILKV